ncbi:hypothetical protein PRZ48_012855 [Zasmidium cellare]|uniref:Sulfotransferase n=1 Tax=Zasmidium cellare TaxID=395010 RepID=A0ABR0E2E7_ZASCE|nr:hypothetical protein PRZ48_012855 [Zasmidium cellare]
MVERPSTGTSHSIDPSRPSEATEASVRSASTLTELPALDAAANSTTTAESNNVSASRQRRRSRHKNSEGLLHRITKYDAVGDLPGFAFVDELVAYYPQARFILTDRNVDSWARAMRASCFVEVGSWAWFLRGCWDGQYVRPLRRLLLLWIRKFCRFDFGDGLREAYFDHVQHCLKVVPKEKLLILRFGEQSDWHDLCEFLGKDVPETPYPVVDDELVLLDQRQQWDPHWRMALGKLCAFALGAALTASLCWCIIE